MKRFYNLIISLVLAFTVACFATACDFSLEGTGGAIQPGLSATDIAAAEFNAQKALVEEAKNSTTYDEEGNITAEVYTQASIKAMEEALGEFATFSPITKTVEQIYEAVQAYKDALAKLVTVDQFKLQLLELLEKAEAFLEDLSNLSIYTFASFAAFEAAYEPYKNYTLTDKKLSELEAAYNTVNNAFEQLESPEKYIDSRLQTAITQLKMYKTDENGNIYFKPDESGQLQPCDKDDPEAEIFPDKGVDSIVYDNDTNTAVFNLSAGSENTFLKVFVDTEILNIFDRSFADIYRIAVDVEVFKDAEAEANNNKTIEQLVIDTGGESGSGMSLALTMLCVCAGYDQILWDAYVLEDTSEFSSVLDIVKSATYAFIENKSCQATVTFNNANYYYTTTFTVNFSEIPTA